MTTATSTIRNCLIALAGAAILATGMGVSASATELGDEFDEVRNGYAQLGIDPGVTERLIEKLENGSPIDSLTPGAEPVRTDSFIQEGDTAYASDGDRVSVRWFADGSPAVTAAEVPTERTEPTGTISPMSIQGCSYSSGSGYASASGCTISGWWGTVQMAFLADYTLVQGGPDYIAATYNGWQQCAAPTTCSRPSEIQSSYREGTSHARSRWASTVTAPWGSWEVWMQLNVGGDSAWSTSS